MENTLKIEKFLDHPIQKVWDALTNPQSVYRWFLPGDFKAVPGYRYEFTGTPKERWDGKLFGTILEVKEPHKLSYTFNTNELNCEMRVEWQLKESKNGTLLTLIHFDFDKLVKNVDLLFGDINKGWNECIKDIEKLLSNSK